MRIQLITSFAILAAIAPSIPATNSESSSSLPAADEIRIFDASGKGQTNRPISISRPFVRGEIANFAQASVNGTNVLTQCDVKNRWPDGSLKFAVVSFVVPSIPSKGSVVVSFSNQASGNTTGQLDSAAMLAPDFDFEAEIQMSGARSESIRAREMLSAGAFRYWLRGPIVTAVIIEGRTPARAFDKDFGDGSQALHPIYEAWFYPQDHRVRIGYTIENTWASSSATHDMRDLQYALTLRAGFSHSEEKFSQGPFVHIGASRWHKSFWVGSEPPAIRVDHNFRYLERTKAVPEYGPNLQIAGSLVGAQYSVWKNSKRRTIDGDSTGIGNFDKELSAGGASDWIGLANLWDTLYLLTMDERMFEKSLGNADLGGRIPWHFREADSAAGTGKFFDAGRTVDTFGRVVSVNARVQATLSELTDDCEGRSGVDQIKTGAIDGQHWVTTRDHMPDLAYIPYLTTGEYYYLEEIQYQGAFIVAWKLGCIDPKEGWPRQGSAGYLNDTQVRGEAWALRTLSYAAFISPDDSPEKAYFEDKLLNNIARWEGMHDVALSNPSKAEHWNYGKTRQWDSRGLSPLGSWGDRGGDFVQPPLRTDGSLRGAASPWEENFVTITLGICRDFGYPTDGLLKFQAKRLLNQVLNPDTNHILIEAYRYPTITKAGQWVRSWSENDSYYQGLPNQWRQMGSENPDHSYGFIAMAAISFVYPYSAGSYKGADAWEFMRKHKPNQETFATTSPKWDIVPRSE